MANYQAITKTDFAEQRWKRYDNYGFAAGDAVAPLVVQELPPAALCLPIAFIQQEERFFPAAVQGLQAGQNLFVASDGRWVGRYTPATYRAHPFALGEAENDQWVLCIDTESGLIGTHHAERFFDEAGEPSAAIQSVLNFLKQVRANLAATSQICAALGAEGLIAPWLITLKGKEGEQALQGLFRIDEAKFNSLGSEALYRLHHAGALPVIYCQLLSMQHLPSLGQLAEAQAAAKARLPAAILPADHSSELDFDFFNNGGTISFSNN